MDTFSMAVAISIGFNAPERVERLRPGRKKTIALEDVHPMLRPVRNRG